MPYIFVATLPSLMEKPVCESNDKIMKVRLVNLSIFRLKLIVPTGHVFHFFLQIQQWLGEVILNRTDLGCPNPCDQIKYKVTLSQMGSNSCAKKDACVFYPYFPTTAVTVEEEFRGAIKKYIWPNSCQIHTGERSIPQRKTPKSDVDI
jgi:hypothetical protein